MSVCPQCRRNFGDQEFRICPVDGANLVDDLTVPVDPMLGRVLDGRFRLIEVIGRGGMGAVYKATHIQMDRVCAIKLVSPVSSDKDAALARFRREARLTSRIDSPNAITIYDFGEAEPGLLYLAMEYIDGITLAEVLQRQSTLPPERVVSIATQTANALAAAHSLGIVHRDLKPSNIMLINRNGLEVVKVLDFGIAKSVAEPNDDRLTQTGFLLGTPTYMAPEQVLGESVTSRTDVYSLAIIVYEMLTGRVPFGGDNLRTLMMSRVTGEPTPLRAVAPSVSEAIEKVVMSGLARQQEFRLPDVQTFVRSLNAAVSGQATFDSTLSRLNESPEAGRSENASPEHRVPDISPENRSSYDTPTMLQAPANGSAYTIQAPTSAEVLQTEISREETIAAYLPTAKPGAPQSTASAKPGSKTYLGVLAILGLVVVILGGAGVGVFLYVRSLKDQPPNNPANPTVTTSQTGLAKESPSSQTNNNQAIDAHYQRGRTLQQDAQRLLAKGSLQDAQEKNLEATVEYRKALELRPDFPEAHENLAVAFYDLGKTADAIAEYELAIAQSQKPGAQLLTNYGMALLTSDRFGEAASAFSRAIEYQPNDADLYYYKGFSLHFAGDKEGAREAFLQYLRIAPDGQHAKNVKAILEGRAKPTLNSAP